METCGICGNKVESTENLRLPILKKYYAIGRKGRRLMKFEQIEMQNISVCPGCVFLLGNYIGTLKDKFESEKRNDK